MSCPDDRRIAVVSSLLSSMRYSIDATLELEFRSDAIDRSFAVPHAIFQGLIAAASKGAYCNHHVRSRFRYQRLA